MSLLISAFPYCLVSNPHLLASPLVPHSSASFLCPHSAAFLCRRRERRRSSSYTPLLLYSQHSLRRQEGTTTTTTTIRRGQHEADWRNSGKFLCNGVNDSSGGGRVRIAQSSSTDEKEIPEEEGEEEEASLSIDDLKTSLRTSLEGLNRGIFGVQSAQRQEIENLLQLLEASNPCPRPTETLNKVKGEWRLLYSTISILGSKRTKLGLRDFITLGDFLQIIDIDQRKAVNKVGFSVAGLGMLKGSFTIEASYTIASPTRVNIEFKKSAIVPDQLLTLFQKNYDMLLSIFNPAGWLEITFVDDSMRVGRDDKGNVFLLERTS